MAFTRDIIMAAAAHGLTRGLYIGCGNGRNLLPMLAAGLDLTGLDISGQAISQLRRRRPDLGGQLVTGGLAVLPPATRYGLVIGIQVFQHGTRAAAHRHLADAAARVAQGGLLCVRVNATATDLAYEHERKEEHPDGSFTVRYLAGPKTGLDVHFFTVAELTALVDGEFRPSAGAAAGQHSPGAARGRPVVAVGGDLAAHRRLRLPGWDCPRLGLPRLGLPRLGLPRLGLPRLGLPRLGAAPATARSRLAIRRML